MAVLGSTLLSPMVAGRPIKGNFKRKGGCIYHTPWSRHYRRTKVVEARGDRWFADEAEAIGAGCREPRQFR